MRTTILLGVLWSLIFVGVHVALALTVSTSFWVVWNVAAATVHAGVILYWCHLWQVERRASARRRNVYVWKEME